jgi:hypothetical protein
MHEADRPLNARIHRPESMLLGNGIPQQSVRPKKFPCMQNFCLSVNNGRATVLHCVLLLEISQFMPARVLIRVFRTWPLISL